jgi:hypothetical protein
MCTLDISLLPTGAHAAHIIPGLTLHSLLSVVTMCNAGYTITFTKIGCTIVYRGQTVVCGHKCTRTGLWTIPLTPWSPTAPTALSAINLPSIATATNVGVTSSEAKYVHYMHQLLWFPLAATLLHTLAASTKLTTHQFNHCLTGNASTTSNTSSHMPSVNSRQPNNPTKQHLPWSGNVSALLPPFCQPLPPLATCLATHCPTLVLAIAA